MNKFNTLAKLERSDIDVLVANMLDYIDNGYTSSSEYAKFKSALHDVFISMDFDELMKLCGKWGNDAIYQPLLQELAYIITKKASTPTKSVTGTKINYPYINDGKINNHFQNTEACFKYHGIIIKGNVITKENDYILPANIKNVDGYEGKNKIITSLKGLLVNNKVPTVDLLEHIKAIANEYEYNPVADYLRELNWDGTDYITELSKSITLNDKSTRPIFELFLKKWLVQAVAAVCMPAYEFNADGLLVFVGKQGVGKSRWINSIIPNKNWFRGNVQLNCEDKDSVHQATTNWVNELGELDATFRKTDIAKLKGFITANCDVYRKPYAYVEEKYSRRSVYFGSVNDTQYLNDNENRRFWTIHVDKINIDHGINLDQLWAQVYKLFMDGYDYHLSGNEISLVNEMNNQFTSVDPVIELVLNKGLYKPEIGDSNTKRMNCLEILEFCGYDSTKITKALKSVLAKYLVLNGFEFSNKSKRYAVGFGTPDILATIQASSILSSIRKDL